MNGELVPRAIDIKEQLIAEARERIDARVVEKRAEELERKIVEHYTKRARDIMLPIWKECRKRTGHRRVANGSNYQCATCYVPMVEGEESTDGRGAKSGFASLGEKLRQADREAGVEWIP